jgi:hypothetical protein
MHDAKTTRSPSPRLAASALAALAALLLAGALMARPLQLPVPAVGAVLALLALRLGVMAAAVGGAPEAPGHRAPAGGLRRPGPHPSHA